MSAPTLSRDQVKSIIAEWHDWWRATRDENWLGKIGVMEFHNAIHRVRAALRRYTTAHDLVRAYLDKPSDINQILQMEQYPAPNSWINPETIESASYYARYRQIVRKISGQYPV